MIGAGWLAVLSAVELLGPALALTIVIEVPVAVLMGLRGGRAVASVTLVNVVTNPVLNLIVLALVAWVPAVAYLPSVYWSVVTLLELVVVVVEWRLLLWALGGSSRRMLLTSVVMNAASFGAGLLVSWWRG